MEIIHKVDIDLLKPGAMQMVFAMQADENSRVLEITLSANGEVWNIPEDISFSVAYLKPDKTRGIYDTLPDGTSAATFSENVVSVKLAPQMLTAHGLVQASVVMTDSSMNRLNTFPLTVNVIANPSVGATESKDYYSLTAIAAIGDLNDLETNDKSSIVAAINEILAGGTTGGGSGSNSGQKVNPVLKTDDMTQPVGVDADGRLWVAPIGGGSSGGDTEVTTHGIVWDLVNVTSSNAVASVSVGASLYAMLTAAEGYTLGDVIVTMGGETLTGVWNADTATITIALVTGDVIISCAGVEVVGDTLLPVSFSYGNIIAETGKPNTTQESRQYSELINCIGRGLRIDVPASSEYFVDGKTAMTYAAFAYDANGTYISGCDANGKVNETPASFGGWLICNLGDSIYLPSGYQYIIVKSNDNGLCASNSSSLEWLNSGELKFYLTGNGGGASTPTSEEEPTVMMASFDRVYTDTGVYTEDLPPKWDGMFSIHRGYSTAPNNTLQAIWEAKKHGYNCCELDVRYTSDARVVLCHDATVTGTVNGESVTYTVAETPLATLQAVCIGNTAFPDAKICSLEDAMRLCRRIGMRPEIDYKVGNEQLYKDCVALSMKYGLQDDTLHACYGMNYALAVKNVYEKANLRVDGALLDADDSLDTYLPKPGNLYAYYEASACGKTDGINVGANVSNETRILTHKEKGYKMYVWNVTPYLLPDVMQWEPDILQPQSSKDGSDWYTLIRDLNSFDGLVW